MSTAVNPWTRLAVTLLVAAGIFVAAILLPKLLLTHPVGTLATSQGLELLLSLLAIALLGKMKFSDYGFRLPLPEQGGSVRRRHWLLFALGALALGALSSIAIVVAGGSGNPLIRKLTLPQILIFVWVVASSVEEVFTRGFVQGHLSCFDQRSIRLLFFRIPLPALISALAFASMHFVLLVSGADWLSMTIIWLFTFGVGLMAGYQRAVTGSLVPAIGVHFLANVGGVIGGVIAVVIKVMAGGKVPGM